MSKAKAILQRIVDGDNRGDFFISNALLKEIEAALSEPEQEHKTCSLSFLKGYARGFDVAREDYKQKVINAFGVDDE